MLHRPPLHYPERPLHHFLQDAADRHPERIALRFGDDVYTYRELDSTGNSLATALAALGVGPGSRVALAVTNRPEWVIAQHAVSLAGAAVVLPNPNWKASEFEHAFGLTRPDVVIADAAIAEVLDAAGAPATRICVDADAPPGWISFWDLVFGTVGTRPDPLPASVLDADFAYPFSSGTTGLPKAVRHTHRSLVAAVINWNSACAVRHEDHVQFFLPLFHIYGIAITGCTWISAATITLFPRFDLDTMLGHIEEERVTLAFGAAPIAVAMANHPKLEQYDLSSLRYMMWAATPIAREVADRVTERSGIRWLHAYGTTEVPGLHCNPVDSPDRWRLDSPGLPVSDLEVRIVDLLTQEDVAAGTEGEILVRGPHMMAGYLPESADADAFLDGFVRTGDVGWVEPDGWIHITDRAKEMIKVSGFSVSPAEIEATLHGHPAVADCGVYGVPHPTKGESPKAAIVLTVEGAATEDELRAHVAAHLAGYKHVDEIVFLESIPRTTSGKVLRRELKGADATLGAVT
ncbi:MAG TPA: AMP-binding protein [Acidimicrobiia bacterium]|jgi:acyl-CoA synthetase (AMP-forming)/AMP-acid ligase II